MSDTSQGPGWWIASDGKWYAPELHADAAAPEPPAVLSVATIPVDGTQAPAEPGGPDGTSDASVGRVTSRLPLALVGVVFTAGIGFLLFSLLGSGSSAGASSPEDALEGIVQAMNDEDVLGIATLVDIEEFGLVADALNDGSGDVDLTGLPGGVDFTITSSDGGPITATFSELGGPDSGLVVASLDDAVLTLTRTGEDPFGVAIFDDRSIQVFSTGVIEPGSEARLELRSQGRGFSIRGTGRINGESLGRFDERVEDVPLEVVFIENGGRWYFSLGYTIAHLAVSAGVVDEPDYGAWRSVLANESSGADTPTGAVRRLFDALPTLDLEDGVLALDPVETKLLHDFMPIILDLTDADRREALEDAEFEVVQLELSEDIDGDTARVFLDVVSIRLTESNGEESMVELDGDWCYRFEDRFDTVTGCLDQDIAVLQDQLDQQLTDSGLNLDVDLRELLPDRPFVVTSKRNGNWYLSPLATVYGYSENFAALATDAVGQVQGSFTTDAGVEVTQPLPIGESTEVEVDNGGVVALAVIPERHQFEDLFGSELAFYAVTITSDIAVEVQHNIDDPFDSDARNTLRLRAGEPTLLVGHSENTLTRAGALLIRNRNGDGTATVTIDVHRVPIEIVEGDGTTSGELDEAGTPWFVVVSDRVSIDGAAAVAVDFDRFPWFDLSDASSGDPDEGFVFVSGEPGAQFELTVGG